MHDLGQESFPASLADVLRCQVEFDSMLVLRYSADGPPVILHDDFQHQLRCNNLDTYLEGAYLLDPYFIKATKDRAEGLFRLQDIVAPDFIMSPYFRMYYKHSHVSDEVNFLVQLDQGRIFAVSIERATTTIPFNDYDYAVLEALFPVIAELARADWRLQLQSGKRGPNPCARHESLRQRIAAFGENRLSPREREVVQLLLRGYDTREACAALGVTVGTVRVHRKNIYRKLDVSSIGGLFATVLDSVISPDPPNANATLSRES